LRVVRNVTPGARIHNASGGAGVEIKLGNTSGRVALEINATTNHSEIANLTAFKLPGAINKFLAVKLRGAANESSNITYAVLKLAFTLADLDANGNGNVNLSNPEQGDIDPGSLRFYRYCPATGEWQKVEGREMVCGSDRITVHGYGVNLTNVSNMYVWANLSRLSVYGMAGIVVKPTPAVSITPAAGVYSPDAVLLANSIDIALAEELVTRLKERGIELHIVNASNFSEYGNRRYIIILGGHRAYEGVGEIVAGILSDEEKARIEAGSAYIKKRSVFRSGDVVYIFAGKDRNATAQAWQEMYEEVAREIRYNLG